MFDTDPFSDLDQLDAATRQKLADYLAASNAYYMRAGEVNRQLIAWLHNPEAAAMQAIQDYTSDILNPAEDEKRRLRDELMEVAVDIDGLKSILPMIISAVTRSVNLPLLLTLIDFDPKMINQGLEMLRRYLESGMPD